MTAEELLHRRTLSDCPCVCVCVKARVYFHMGSVVVVTGSACLEKQLGHCDFQSESPQIQLEKLLFQWFLTG